MFNALWFRPNGGAERYTEYGTAVLPLLTKAGADILVPFLPVERSLEGGLDPDVVGFVRYPSLQAFDEMWRSDDYQAVAHLRTEAVTKAVLTRCVVEPEHSEPVRLPDTGIAVLNALWFRPGGATRYDEYLATVRPMVANVGGRFISPRFHPEAALGDAFLPDLLFLGYYPSQEALFELVGSDAYAGPAAIRTEAVQRSATTLLRMDSWRTFDGRE